MINWNCPNNSINVNHLIGKEAAEAFTELILSHKYINKVKICHYKAPPRLQERIRMDKTEKKLVKIALKIREDVRIPFWESLFIACLKEKKYTNNLFDVALFHHGIGSIYKMSRKSIKKGKLIKFVKEKSESSSLGFVSEVELKSGDYKHFVFLDFHCEVSLYNNKLVSKICNRLFPKGYILLDSGDSYHAWSACLVTNSERIKILGRTLLYMPIVDGIYIAHQIMQDMSSIRISIGGQRRCVPKVIAANYDLD